MLSVGLTYLGICFFKFSYGSSFTDLLCNDMLMQFGCKHKNPIVDSSLIKTKGEGEGKVAFFSAKRWDRRNRADVIANPCDDAHVVGPYLNSNPLSLAVMAVMSYDYTTAPQHRQDHQRKRPFHAKV